jgi:hypothetical protein
LFVDFIQFGNMIYDVNSKAFKKFTHGQRCAVCFEDFTDGVSGLPNPASKADMPCACVEGICEKCYVIMAKTTKLMSDFGPVIKCPLCQMPIIVRHEHMGNIHKLWGFWCNGNAVGIRFRFD